MLLNHKLYYDTSIHLEIKIIKQRSSLKKKKKKASKPLTMTCLSSIFWGFYPLTLTEQDVKQYLT